MIKTDRRITITHIVGLIGIGRQAVHTIIKEFGYSEVCARWVPRQLTEELRQSRVDICSQMLQRYSIDGNDFINCIITGDESWAHHYEPESKRQSMQWHCGIIWVHRRRRNSNLHHLQAK